MSAQSGEIMRYENRMYSMASHPLGSYLRKEDISFVKYSSACIRGYEGTWEIKNHKLFLIDLMANVGYKKVGIEYLFQGQTEVFAEWFTGEIRMPTGEELESVHLGYASTYEYDLFFDIVNGELTNIREVDNREAFFKRQNEAHRKKTFWEKVKRFINRE